MGYRVDDKFVVADPVVMKEYELGTLSRGVSMLTLEDPECQNLMDALWQSGVRPSNGEGNVGMIGAMKEHIQDLRADVDWHRKVTMEAVKTT